jgi:hypothetical protein
LRACSTVALEAEDRFGDFVAVLSAEIEKNKFY